jgi:cell division protein FtsW
MTRSSHNKPKAHRPDYVVAIIIFMLLVFGLIVLSSASAVQSFENFGTNYYYFKHQLFYGVAFGLIGAIVASKIPYWFWKRYALIGIILTIVLLVMVFIPGIGFEHGGARRWILLGPFSLQPTEIVKLAMILYLAAWLEKKGKEVKDLKYGFLPFITILSVIAVLVLLQPDAGTLGVILTVSVVMYFIAGASISHLGIIGAGLIGLFFLLIKIAPYRLARFTVFLDPGSDTQGIGYQINQALISVGSGGILGLGLGKSRQKYNYLPEATGDSIFAIVSEELGLIGAVAVVVLFLVFLYRGIRIAKHAPNDFSRLVAVGITVWITFQAFVNIAAIISLIPLTGIPLPFISYGGSALVFSLVGVGILLNISRYTVETHSRHRGRGQARVRA